VVCQTCLIILGYLVLVLASMAVCCASVKSKLKPNPEPSRNNQTKGVKKLKRCWSFAMWPLYCEFWHFFLGKHSYWVHSERQHQVVNPCWYSDRWQSQRQTLGGEWLLVFWPGVIKDRHPMANGCCCSGCREVGRDIISVVFRTGPVSDSLVPSARKFLISYDVSVVA
jgi:hypothetical protein